ncbi:hypothetical protein IQ230_18980 [Gloeocapsopsis crepidinum LEGE 06123]|uniref:Transcriptional regulator n=1 Tax=Gloeocapsopsis crepidinum LEGE 06123 TaxID=588587 RepID=A0ABR9UVR4_9CHRO|nr:hypothetical protein [Gloeocapsopsis crepidinum]MBE9192391.1 hypothetical protein [Gloeocapsopsis crepidinum LEGE 06123]
MTDSIQASQQGLNIVERARRKKGWNKLAYIWCDRASISQATLRRFWAGQAIRSENFFSICDAVGVNWEEVADQSIFEETSLASIEEQLLLPYLVEADDISNNKVKANIFSSSYVEETTRLKQVVIRENHHLVALLCNKTEIEAKQTQNIENFLPIQEILLEIIQLISSEQKTNLPNFLNSRILQLIKHLSVSCCLLILDDSSTSDMTKNLIEQLFSHRD